MFPEGRVYLQAAAGNLNRGHRQTWDAVARSNINADSDLGGEELEKVIKELPRDKEVVQLCQKLPGAILFRRDETDGAKAG